MSQFSKYHYTLVLLICVICGCDERHVLVDYDLEDTPSKLVLTATLNPDSTVKAQITHSYSINSPSFLPIENFWVEDATVLLYENSILVDTLHYDGNGHYLSSRNFHPQILQQYHITVSATGYESVYSLPQFIPDTISISTWQYNDSIGIYNPEAYQSSLESSQQIVRRLNCNFIDPPTVNYYAIRTFPLLLNSNDNIRTYFSSIAGCVAQGQLGCIEDVCFNGQNAQLSIDIVPYENKPFEEQDSLMVVLASVSEAYYKYSLSKEAYILQGDAIFQAPLNLYSNVVNGFGFVSAYSTTSITVKLQ